MGTVQTNDTMVDRTMHRLRRFRDRRMENVLKEFMKSMPLFGGDIYDKLVGDDFNELVSKLPDGMFNTHDKLYINSVGDHRISVVLPMGTKRVRPAGKVKLPGGYMDSSYQGVEVFLDADCPHWQDYLAPAERLVERREKIRTDNNKMEGFTAKLLREWKSLGPVLRAWPPIWDLLDSDDQHRQGARPRGTANHVPAYIGDDELVKWASAQVVQMKLLGV